MTTDSMEVQHLRDRVDALESALRRCRAAMDSLHYAAPEAQSIHLFRIRRYIEEALSE